MDVIDALEKRKSIRSYSIREVEQDRLEMLVKAAKCAPKAGELHVSVITNGDVLHEIDEKVMAFMKASDNDLMKQRAESKDYKPLYGAPCLFMISSKGNYASATSSCAATAVTIAATSLGLGSCYVVTPTLAFEKDENLRAKVAMPIDHIPVCGVLVGYAASADAVYPKVSTANIDYVK